MSYTFPDGIITNKVFVRKDIAPPVANIDGAYLYTNNLGQLVIKDANGADINISTTVAELGAHGTLTGRNNDDHPQYVLLSGRSSGQTINGGSSASGNLTLSSTSNGVKGSVIVNDNLNASAITATSLNCPSIITTNVTGFTSSGIINMGGNKITNLATPTNPTDAVNLAYINGSLITNAVAIGTTASADVNVGSLSQISKINGSSILIGEATSGASPISIGSGGQTGAVVIGGSNVNQSVFIRGNLKINDNNGTRTTEIATESTSGAVTIGGGSCNINIYPSLAGLSLTSRKITSLALGTDPTDAANLQNITNAVAIGTTASAIVNVGSSSQTSKINGSSVLIGEAASGSIPISIGSGGQTGDIVIGGGSGIDQNVFVRGDIVLNQNNGGRTTDIATGATTGVVTIGGGSCNININPSLAGLSLTGKKITSLALGTDPTDAANLQNITNGIISASSVGVSGSSKLSVGVSTRLCDIYGSTVEINSGGNYNTVINGGANIGTITIGSGFNVGGIVLNGQITSNIGTLQASSSSVNIGEATSGTIPVSIGSGGQDGSIVIGGGSDFQSILIRGNIVINNDSNHGTVQIGTGSHSQSVTLGNSSNNVNLNKTASQINSAGSTHIANKTWVATYFAPLSSIKALKENIEPIKDTEKIFNLEPKSFNFIETGEESIGLIAEDVEKVIPELCAYDGENLIGVKYHLLAVMLLEEVKKLRQEINSLRQA